MADTTITTVGDLIATLAVHDLRRPIRVATESVELRDHTIGRVACTPSDIGGDCALPNDAPVVRIGTGYRSCCFPDGAAERSAGRDDPDHSLHRFPAPAEPFAAGARSTVFRNR